MALVIFWDGVSGSMRIGQRLRSCSRWRLISSGCGVSLLSGSGAPALAERRFRLPERSIAFAAFVAFAALGGFIFYNTNVLNRYRTRKQSEDLRVRYERVYRKYREMPQPRITGVKFNADIFPERRSVKIAGHYEIANKTSQPVSEVLVSLPEDLQERRVKFMPPATLQSEERPLNAAVYKMAQPLAPGAVGTVDFELAYAPHGFPNQEAPTSVVYNGTFLNSGMLPQFGYQDRAELSEDNTRRKHGLKPKERMADLNDAAARRNTYISNDADWVTFDATVSTSADQIADCARRACSGMDGIRPALLSISDAG